MVGDHHHFFRIEDFFNPDFPEFLDGDRGRNIIRQNQISPDIDEITRGQIFTVGMGSQYFFS